MFRKVKTYFQHMLLLSQFQSLVYFFRILDVKHAGYLNAFSLNYFFRDILKQMEKLNQEPVR